MSNRDLWQFITGRSLTEVKERVKEEISKNEEKLKLGLVYYKSPRVPHSSALSKEKDLDNSVIEFVKKLSLFLQLDQVQSLELYHAFTSQEFRGTAAELQNLLTVDRHTEMLLSRLRDYYYNERLYLLRSIKHMLSHWQDDSHPYYSQYRAFVQKLKKTKDFIQSIQQQYDKICEDTLPTWEFCGKYVNRRHVQIWLIQNLKEQCELLEIMLSYYYGIHMEPIVLLNLANKFKRQGFGRRQANRHLLGEHAETFLQRIGFLQVILIIEGLELDDLLSRCEKQSVEEHSISKSKEYETLDQYFESLGQAVDHGPLLLAWAAVRELGMRGDEVKTAALGKKALSVKVFSYLISRLNSEPFSGDSITATLCHTIIYRMMCCILEAFHHDTLGDEEGLKGVAAVLLRKPKLAEDFWQKGMDSSLGTLFQEACYYFPLDLCRLAELCVSLAEAGQDSAEKVMKMLKNMTIYTEVMCSASEVKATEQPSVWQLVKDRRPYSGSDQKGAGLLIPCGTRGEYQQLGSLGIVHWDCAFSAWDIFLCELRLILSQIAQGQGMIQTESVGRVSFICRLLYKLLAVHEEQMFKSVAQLPELMVLVYQLIERFSQVYPPLLELLAVCIDCVRQVAFQDPLMAWRRLQQTGLLPYFTENINNLAEVSSGSNLNAASFGAILAGVECTHGQYSLTVSLLELISALVQPLSHGGEVDVLLGSIVYITREIFPMFRKWRYSNMKQREIIGHRCLEIFHRVLNVMKKPKHTTEEVSVQQACIYSLLYTEAGQSLLDIVGTSIDTVNAALASQGSATEGAGVELIQMIRMAFSVLNRLLLLRPRDASQSPVENSLAAQSTGAGGKRNVTATIAQYIYHRHDPRLAALAIVLLKRLAMIFPMSILACLGDEAEPIRDAFLSRLQADTEDILLKVVILEFLSASVSTQPGLIELFINVKTKGIKPANKEQKTANKQTDQDVVPDKVSCLPVVLGLIESTKQGTYACPSPVLCAAVEFIHALWHGQRQTAIVALRQMPDFWYSVCLSLTRELQPLGEAGSNIQVLQKEMRSCANIMKILCHELYHNQGLDENLKVVISDLLSKGHLLYWSQYICDSLEWSSHHEVGDLSSTVDWSENSTLQLLYAWRNLILILCDVGHKVKCFHIPDTVKDKILQDVLTGIQSQFSIDCDITALNIKLASVSSAFYIMLLRHWVSSLDCWEPTVKQLEIILGCIMECCGTPLPSIHIGLLGALSLIIQHVRQNKLARLDEGELASLVPKVCRLIQQSVHQLPCPAQLSASLTPGTRASSVQLSASVKFDDTTSSSSTRMDLSHSALSSSRYESAFPLQSVDSTPTVAQQEPQKDAEVKLKLVTSALCLLDELVLSLPSPEYWLPEVRQYALLETLLESMERWSTVNKGAEYVHTVFMLLLTLAKHPQSAESLAGVGFIQQLCLIISHLYNQPEQVIKRNNIKNKTSYKVTRSLCPSWSSIYCLSISLFTSLLHILKYNFLTYAIEFVGVHQDRMHQCLSSAHVLLQHDLLEEATRTCHFLSELSLYRRQWGLQLPDVLRKLMMDVCMMMQGCVSLLIRPTLLQHMLEKQRNGQDLAHALLQDKYVSAPFIRSMSQQPEDSDYTTQEVMIVQNALLSIVCQCLVALKRFSPDLCEIILDQSVDVSEYEGFLQIGFSTPPVEPESPLTFGTLVSCISLCLFLLNKVDPRGPAGTPTKQDIEKSPLERSLIMFVLENTLYLTMSQALRCLKDPVLDSRDKQLIKRELSAELSSFMSGMQRYIRRGSGSHTPAAQQTSAPYGLGESSYLKLVNSFIRKVLR